VRPQRAPPPPNGRGPDFFMTKTLFFLIFSYKKI